ncbi:hypothetical protein B0J18DRAFT_197404 [Chaetomium sp. MPI-SDFR-AT-0129]|nr:hypothetical protein B0J18DRAFT_197404 [Chaetomium sp. MPI-SDFR-AT-0129]
MPLTWESVYSFFSPPASRGPSPNSTPSLFSGAFSSNASTKQTDLPMPPTTTFGMPSPADSSTSSLTGSERDYSPPGSASYARRERRPSTSSNSSRSTTSLEQPIRQGPNRTHTTPAVVITSPSPPPSSSSSSSSEINHEQRPAPPRRSATDIVAPEPMSRTFPKPAVEPSLDELLARKPLKHSLGYYVQNSSRVAAAKASQESLRASSEEAVAERARKFEETKRRLMMDQEKLAGLGKR